MRPSDISLILQRIKNDLAVLLAAVNAKDPLLPNEGLAAISEFIAECVRPAPATRVPAAAIRAHFIAWCLRGNPEIPIPSQKRLGTALREAGYKKRKIAGRIEYINLQLRAGLDLTGLEGAE